MFAYFLQMQNKHSVSVCLQVRASGRPTCEPPSCRSFWRRCSVCSSQCAPPRRTCHSSTSPLSCRWSTAPSSTAVTRPSSAWREYWILLGFSGPWSSRQMNVKWQYCKIKQAFVDFIFLGSHHFLPSVHAASHHATLGSCTGWSWLCLRSLPCSSIPALLWWKEL